MQSLSCQKYNSKADAASENALLFIIIPSQSEFQLMLMNPTCTQNKIISRNQTTFHSLSLSLFLSLFFSRIINCILVWCIECCCVCHQGQICKKADSCLNLYPCVIKYYLILSYIITLNFAVLLFAPKRKEGFVIWSRFTFVQSSHNPVGDDPQNDACPDHTTLPYKFS